ncbi:MAG TPA: glycosyltransferase family 39 protein [Polyangiaceae bacterium]
MKRLRLLLRDRADAAIALGLFAGYLALLLATAGSLGFMRDEGFYFTAARAYGKWFELLWSSPGEALSPAVTDRYWTVNHEHPSLLKGLFALSNRFLAGFFAQPSSSFRFPAMALSSLAVALTYLWGARLFGRMAGLVAALSFAFMPRVFFHAHLACFDLPVATLWLVTSYAYSRSLASGRALLVVLTGLAYGLLLDTKHNAWLFPFALGLHFALTQGWALANDLRSGRPWWRRLPPAWASMLLLGPLVLYALWPWLWHDTAQRLRDYVRFHTQHEYYNMEFLGRTYWQPPLPRAYAWLMTLSTVSLVTLVLAAIGAGAFLRRFSQHQARSDCTLWGASILIGYAPWLSPSTPIFGGTKHWLTAYPFVCLFAGLGFVHVCQALRELLPRLARPALVAGCVLVGPAVMTLHAHPFALSAYTPLVGGAPGAASLGLNRTFWGYTTQSLAPFIDHGAPTRGRVYVHDTALASFAMFQEDGRLRRDLRATLDIATSDVALYHHEPHMSRVEHQIWTDYGTLGPSAIATFDGVPVAWAYVRRQAGARQERALPAAPAP